MGSYITLKTLSSAFDYLIQIHGFDSTLTRKGVSYNLKLAYSNYHRNLDSVSNTVTKGREFVVTDSSMSSSGLSEILRGDMIETPQGKFSVIEVIPLVLMKGVVAGYRVRTN